MDLAPIQKLIADSVAAIHGRLVVLTQSPSRRVQGLIHMSGDRANAESFAATALLYLDSIVISFSIRHLSLTCTDR